MKKNILLTLIGLVSITATAQVNNLQMQFENLPQNMSVNPALAPNKSYLSLPLIGSFDVNARTSISLNNAVTQKNGANYLDYSKLYQSMKGANINTVNFNLDLLRGGFYIGENNFIDINMSVRTSVGTSLPADIIPFVFDNPIDKVDGEFNIAADPSFLGWAEFGVGYSRRISENFRVGIRAKYIMGLVGIQSEGIDFNIKKNYNQYTVSGEMNLIGGNFNFANTNTNGIFAGLFSNPGFGIDLGGEFVSDDQKIKAMISVSDLGMIFWNAKNSSKLQSSSKGETFVFDGFGNLSGLSGGNFGQLADSVFKKVLNVVGVDTLRGSYSTLMPTRYHAMAEYSIDDDFQHNVSLSFMGVQPYHKGFDYAITAGYTYRSKNQRWQVAGNYTFRPHIPIGIGVGGAYSSKRFQIYLGIDNIMPIFDLANAKNVGARFAINFFLGR